MAVDTVSVLHDNCVMKNVTITLPEQVARWARVHAAMQDKSLSRMISDMLQGLMQEDEDYECALRSFLGRKPAKMKKRGRYPTRDEVHER